MATILCPSGHRHEVPEHFGGCWLAADDPREVPVTLREFDVANELLRDGADNQTIAKRLYVTEDTVKSHLKKLLARTGAKTRGELVVAVFRGRVRLVPMAQAGGVFWNATKAPLGPLRGI